ncbi:L,D-transpeptidase [Emcibacter sp. SYSU 3D8]|uniref:L,D-transpeptidase family protein n=1 Tax=Emcibacter sp. SYSU 3D8 TaxID=3133969 RepID=UPI0031FE6F56
MPISRLSLACAALLLPVAAYAAEPAPPSDDAFTAAQINAATFDGAEITADARSALAMRVQVLLDGQDFSPGVIDGYFGDNVTKALAAWEEANGLPVDGQLDEESWDKLSADEAPVFGNYTITSEDLKGPYLAEVPSDYAEMAKMKHLSFTGADEMLAERFHMDIKLLHLLNPDADWGKAGTRILVASLRQRPETGKAAKVTVSRESASLRAIGADGKVLAFFPVTVGSDSLPSPSGTHKVKVVVHNPDYSYRPDVNFTQGGNTENMRIAPGPNGPVGTVWIGLDKPTYGIHGTAEPSPIGKHFSHGCARLTNWDAETLAGMVEPGVPVSFED